MRIRGLILVLVVMACGWGGDKKPEDDGMNGGIVYGVDHVFTLRAPAGWVLDNSSGVAQGLHAVFYPKGGSWEKSRVVMYANTVHKEKPVAKSMRQLIADDVAEFAAHTKGIQITDEAAVETHKKKAAVVKRFVAADRNVFEMVAYIEETKVVVMLVISARSQPELDAAAHSVPAVGRFVLLH